MTGAMVSLLKRPPEFDNIVDAFVECDFAQLATHAVALACADCN